MDGRKRTPRARLKVMAVGRWKAEDHGSRNEKLCYGRKPHCTKSDFFLEKNNYIPFESTYSGRDFLYTHSLNFFLTLNPFFDQVPTSQ